MESPDTKEVFDRVNCWLAARGGRVVVDPAGENLIRSRRAHETPEFPWVVEVQGWPNLIHEVVHILFAGRMAEDSGFDYAQIPLNLERADHRAWLWDELAACTLSSDFSPAIFGAREPRSGALPLAVHAWFAEQVEILPIFYGRAGDLQGFCHMVNEAFLRFPGEFASVHRTAHAQLRQIVGQFTTLELTFVELWRTFSAHLRVEVPEELTADLLSK